MPDSDYVHAGRKEILEDGGELAILARGFDAATAAEAGRRSGEARRRSRDLTPEDRAQDAISAALGRLTSELINAALGRGDFEDLKLDTRVTALLRLIEWKLGRPAAAKPKEEAVVPTVPEDGDALFS